MKKTIIISSIVIVLSVAGYLIYKNKNKQDDQQFRESQAMQLAGLLHEKFPDQDPNVLLSACMKLTDIDKSALWDNLVTKKDVDYGYGQLLARYGIYV